MFQKFPLFKVLFVYTLGVLLVGFLPTNYVWLIAACSVILTAILWFVIGKSVAIWLNVILLLSVCNTLSRSNKQINLPQKEGNYIVKCVDRITEKTKSVKLIGDVVFSDNNFPRGRKLLLYLPKSKETLQLLPGDVIQVRGLVTSVNGPKNPNEFNYQNYLSLHGITEMSFIKERAFVVHLSYIPSISRYATIVQQVVENRLESFGFDHEANSVLKALLIGKKTDLEPELMHAYASAGAMHVLAVSGLHVGILYLLFSPIFGFLKRKRVNIWIITCLGFGIIWSYSLITGMSDSVVRAATMFSFMHVGNNLKRPTSIYNTLIASALFLLIINPNLLFMVGFQLSYAAVLGIVYLHPKLLGLINIPRNWVLKQVWNITCVSMAAQIATFPLALYYFHQFPVFFMLSNLIVIPLVWIIMVLSFGLLMLSTILGETSAIYLPLKWIVELLNYAVKWIESIPYSQIEKISISRTELIVIYSIIGLIVFILFERKKWALNPLMLLTVSLAAFQGYEGYQQRNQHFFIVYSVGKDLAAEFVKGKSSVLFASKSLLKNESKMLFHIRHNQWAHGINQSVELPVNSLDTFKNQFIYHKNHMIQFENERILLVSALKDTAAIKTFHPDYIISKVELESNVAEVIYFPGLRGDLKNNTNDKALYVSLD